MYYVRGSDYSIAQSRKFLYGILQLARKFSTKTDHCSFFR